MKQKPRLLVGNKVADITPHHLAILFCDLDSEEQAKFYNSCSELSSKWRDGKGGWCFQLQSITDEKCLTYGGRRFMDSVGEYSHWGLVPSASKAFWEKLNED